jgi:hypothetical protein
MHSHACVTETLLRLPIITPNVTPHAPKISSCIHHEHQEQAEQTAGYRDLMLPQLAAAEFTQLAVRCKDPSAHKH